MKMDQVRALHMVKDKDLYSKGIYYLVFIFLFLLEIWVLVNKRLTAPTNLEHQQEAIEVIKKAEVEATIARMLEAANKPEMQRKAEMLLAHGGSTTIL